MKFVLRPTFLCSKFILNGSYVLRTLYSMSKEYAEKNILYTSDAMLLVGDMGSIYF